MVLRFIVGLGLVSAWGVITTLINEAWPKGCRKNNFPFYEGLRV